MPIEINWLREYKGGDPAKFREYQKQRFKDGPDKMVDTVLEVDEEWRKNVGKINELKTKANKIQKETIAPAKKAKQPCDEALAEVAALKKEIEETEKTLPVLEAQRDKLVSKLGNIVDPDVPIGKDEDTFNSIVVLKPLPAGVTLPCPVGKLQYQLPPSKPLKHDELLWRIGGFDDERGRKVAGHRGYFLTNAGVLLNQALINYAIAFLRGKSFDDGKTYDVLQPPYMMRKELMSGIAQLEDFDEQLYKVSGKTDDPDGASEKYLIATSEQPMCGYHMDEWLEEKELPKRYAGVSTCFRKEAGSSGRDIRGIFRVHQFEKIEQFVICKDDVEESRKMHQQMLDNAMEFYDNLGISYRVVNMCSGELNDAAVKKYDLEAWFPGQEAYRELVSASNCTDFQSRSMGIRCGSKKLGQVSASYCHMLNATLCATGRGICCILENHQTPDGVVVPEVLRPFMGGLEFMPFVKDARVDEADKPVKGKNAAKAKGGGGKEAPAKAPAAAEKPKADKKAAAAAAAATTPPPAATTTKAAAPPPAPAAPAAAASDDPLVGAITSCGDAVRALKEKKAAKDEIMAAVGKLNEAKAAFKAATGADYVAPGQQGSSKDKKEKGGAAPAAAAAPADKKKKAKGPKDKGTKAPPPAAKPAAAAAAANPKPAGTAAAGSSSSSSDTASALNEALLFQSYVSGYSPTSLDASHYAALYAQGTDSSKAAASGLNNLARWLTHMASFSAAERGGWGGAGAGAAAAVPVVAAPVMGSLPKPVKVVVAPAAAKQPAVAAAAAEEDEDEMDLGFDEDEDEEEETSAPAPNSRQAKAAALKAENEKKLEEAKAAALARLAKKEANQRSLCNLEIKPWEAEQDLLALFAKIKAEVVRDGLKWSENCNLVDVAFGVKKIVCTAIIPVAVSMDEIIDEMTEDTFADEIQSMNMTSMSLL